MKKMLCLIIGIIVTTTYIFSQNYQRVMCHNCYGYGGWNTIYGPITCPVCKGLGVLVIPAQQYSPTFQGSQNPYIYKKEVYLRRAGNSIVDKFYLFVNGSTKYVSTRKDGKGVMYKVTGKYIVNINHIDYICSNL